MRYIKYYEAAVTNKKREQDKLNIDNFFRDKFDWKFVQFVQDCASSIEDDGFNVEIILSIIGEGMYSVYEVNKNGTELIYPDVEWWDKPRFGDMKTHYKMYGVSYNIYIYGRDMKDSVKALKSMTEGLLKRISTVYSFKILVQGDQRLKFNDYREYYVEVADVVKK